MPGSHPTPPSNNPRWWVLALRDGVPRSPWCPSPLGEGFGGDADGGECEGGCGIGGGSGRGDTPQLVPAHPTSSGCAQGSSIQDKAGRGGRSRQRARHSQTNVTSTICCSVRGRGKLCMVERGWDSVTPGGGSATEEYGHRHQPPVPVGTERGWSSGD